jgi:Fibronectin type III domain
MRDGTIASTPPQFELTVAKDQVVQGLGDFNGDGKSDILWRNSATGVVTMWLMNGGTVLSAPAGKTVGLDWAVQEIWDFSGDRKADILWRNGKTGVLSVWLMNGGTVQSSGGGQTVASSWGVQTSMPPRISLAWQHSSAAETGFKIERSPNGSTSWTQIGTTPANVTTYQDAGLAPFTTYYYRVRAYSASGASTYSNVVSSTTR